MICTPFLSKIEKGAKFGLGKILLDPCKLSLLSPKTYEVADALWLCGQLVDG